MSRQKLLLTANLLRRNQGGLEPRVCHRHRSVNQPPKLWQATESSQARHKFEILATVHIRMGQQGENPIYQQGCSPPGIGIGKAFPIRAARPGDTFEDEELDPDVAKVGRGGGVSSSSSPSSPSGTESVLDLIAFMRAASPGESLDAAGASAGADTSPSPCCWVNFISCVFKVGRWAGDGRARILCEVVCEMISSFVYMCSKHPLDLRMLPV